MKFESRIKLLIYILDKLNKRMDRSGETAIQKLIYLMIMKNNVTFDYEYIIYDYGPWSFELMKDIEFLENAHLINKHSDPSGYGSKIVPNKEMNFVSEYLDKTVRKRTRWDQKIVDIIDSYSRMPAKQLALLTTFIYIYNKHPGKNEKEIIDLVKMIKPLHNKFEYENRYKECKEILKGSC